MKEEAAFLDAIRCKPDDDVTRLVYADWLDEQGDEESARKSAYIRLECHLAEIADDSDEYADLQKLRHESAKKLKRKWLSSVSTVAIENCDLQFEFECPKQWDQLRPTKSLRVRFCDACQKNVYYCNEIGEARRHAMFSLCVALDPSIARKEGDLNEREVRMGRIFPPRSYPPLVE